MALPRGTTGSLRPTFVSVRAVALTVRRACAFALNSQCPTGLTPPARASVTIWEATAPVQLPTTLGPGPGLRGSVRPQKGTGWYFKVGSSMAGKLAALTPP